MSGVGEGEEDGDEKEEDEGRRSLIQKITILVKSRLSCARSTRDGGADSL